MSGGTGAGAGWEEAAHTGCQVTASQDTFQLPDALAISFVAFVGTPEACFHVLPMEISKPDASELCL